MAIKTTKPADAAQLITPTHDWSQEASTGFENVTQEDLGRPFLVILQDGSPEVKKTHPEYATKKITGAEAGCIINTLTREILYSPGTTQPITFIPCAYDKAYVEWRPQTSGGGFVRSHRNPAILNECTRDEETGRDLLRNGNQIATTAYFYGLVLREGQEPMPVVIGLTSTQLKKARAWLNMSQAIKLNGPNGKFTPPLFSHTYQLSAAGESNAKGSWYGWEVHLDKIVSDPKLINVARLEAKKSAETAIRLLAPKDDVI